MNPRGYPGALQDGVALTIALLLLLILTLLAVTGMHGAANELALAANEKFRQQAAAAAEVGIEAALASLSQVYPSALPLRAELAVDEAKTVIVTRYHGDVALVSGYSAGRFVGRSFEIRATGSAARGAQAVRILGAVRVDDAMRP